jgi:hypothetical protein
MYQNKCPKCKEYFYGYKCQCGYSDKNQNAESKPFAPRCFVIGCNSIADERRGENVWMCRHHSDEYILKIFPHSIEASVILTSRRLEKEAREAGMTNQEYFRATNKSAYDRCQEIMKQKSDKAKNLQEPEKVF